MFDPNADPEAVAARAAELSLEQLDRLRAYLKLNPKGGVAFYSDPFEIGISNVIATMMSGYAVLKGYVTQERANNGF